MGVFYGPIGFVTVSENPPDSGIWEEIPEERMYRGEIVRNSRKWESTDQVNKNLNISNTISIIIDPYLSNNINTIRYIKWLNSYWEITSIDVEYPRMVLSIGGVYNGPTVGATSDSKEHPRIR